MNSRQTKEKIKGLIDKYQNVVNSGKLKSYSEEETKLGFILPLLELLGWDVKNKNEVSAEEQMKSRGRVDFGFYLNGIVKFYLEAKSLKADLDKEEYAKQAIRYSWHKGVTWAVLTDFESIKVFNAMAGSRLLQDKLVFEISCREYLDDFDRLWLLSRESFEKNLLENYAIKYGKKIKKLTVNEKLFSDLKIAREILTKSLGDWNKKVDQETLEEGVQRILDRLVFIRVLEDKGLESPILFSILREWKADQKRNQLFPMLIDKFRELDEIYNSNIFAKHACEQWEEYDNSIEKVINILYGGGMYEYDFKEIPADILGGVYESYLGYMAQNPIKTDKQEAKAKSRQKRKEQGIYYTPKFIVDYIVKNTLGKKLDEVKSINELKKIKILDPACGSGSFLTKALAVMNDKYKDFGNRGDQYTKGEILTSNIYGVDLDSQAVEIAKLNLLVEALDKKAKLPDLTNNIRVGNSLISGSEEELKKYFGKDWRDKKPFNWQEEFPFCHSRLHPCHSRPLRQSFSEASESGNPCFDIIIGNPPYGAELDNNEKKYFSDKFDIGSTDTAILFIKNSLDFLNNNGQLGFIIPKAFCFASNYKKLRDFVWDSVETIIDCGKVWSEVKLEQVVIILRKGEKLKDYNSGILKNGQIQIIGQINKDTSKKFSFFLNGVSDKEIKIAEKILKNSISLNEISKNQRGAILQKHISEIGDLEAIGGMQIQRFGIKGIKGRINKEKIQDEKAFIKSNSVLVQNIIAHIENPIDHIKIIAVVPKNTNQIIVDTVNQLEIDKNYYPHYIWLLLNSNLINWYAYRFIFGKAIRTMHFDNAVTERIPIIKTDKSKQKQFIDLAKKIIDLNVKLQPIPENSEKWNSIKKEIEKTDRLIDQKVYELYGLNKEEIKIIENS